MKERYDGFISKSCLFKKFSDQNYDSFVRESLNDFLNNNYDKKEYSNSLLSQNKYKILIKKKDKDSYIVYDENDIPSEDKLN